MIKQIRYVGIVGMLVFASVGFAQYTMDLTGVGNGNSADGVYVSPYVGSIWTGAYSGGPAPTTPALYSGSVICDDFSDESFVGDVWNATATNAASVNSSVLFTGGYHDVWNGQSYNSQQDYDAVAWLANQLLLPANVNNATAQTNYSFAIWDIMDGQATDPDGGATGTNGLISQAFAAVASGQVYTNVTVFTPAPNKGVGFNPSQEFLVVGGGPNGGPIVPAPEPASAAVLGVDLLSALAGIYLLKRYRTRA